MLMKRGFALIFVFILFVTSAFSISKEELLKAENYYRKGEYKKSLEIYLKAEKEIPNYEIYYNLGNIYFKLNKFAYAKLYYLRAYKIRQNDSDLLHNLKAVEMRLEDRIKLPEEDPFTKILNSIKNSFTMNTYLIISLILFFIIVLIFVFLDFEWKKYMLFALSFLLVVLFIIDIVKINEYKKSQYILVSPKVDVKSEPTDIGSTVFIIHEGIDFEVKDKVGDWYLIVLKNGYRGWIKAREGKDFLKV